MISERLAPEKEIVRSKRAAQEDRRMAEEENLLKSKDVAHILDCSPDDVHLLVHRGDLKGTKVGRFWRYCLEDVMEYKRKMEEDA
jgi:hypothetical protein